MSIFNSIGVAKYQKTKKRALLGDAWGVVEVLLLMGEIENPLH
jgi:hypothetical protein